jgi:putative ABC transport system permease protein
MFYNYFKLSWRNLLKSPMFTSLNVTGLALGLAVSVLLLLHVVHERSFDRFHSNYSRVHRVMVNAFWDPAQPMILSNAPNAVGPAAKDNIPAVEAYTRVLKNDFGELAFIEAENNKITEEKVYWTDPGYADIFDVKCLYGDLRDALGQPNTVALSKSAAIRFFGTDNPMGKTISIGRLKALAVKAVFEDLPDHSTLDPKVLGSFKTIKWANDRLTWSNSSFETWLLLNASADPKQVESQIVALFDKNVPKEDQSIAFWLQPFAHTHLYTPRVQTSYSDRIGDANQINILTALALAVLLIACFNYMNLATARFQMRFREVGVNKTMGATRLQVASRFYAETTLLTGISMLLAYLFIALGLPVFNHIADRNFTILQLFSGNTLLLSLAVWGVVALFSGAYPAFFLSSFMPKNLLQTNFNPGSGAGLLRRGLVIAQFSASIALIICTVVLFKQMQFIQQYNLGFNPEQVVAVNASAANDKSQIQGLIQGAQQLTDVVQVARSQTFPGGRPSVRSLHKSAEDSEGVQFITNRAAPGIESVLGIKLLAGSTLPDRQESDTVCSVIINKTALDYLGIPVEEAIGHSIDCDLEPHTVICGVMEDFHSESLHEKISAYGFHNANTEGRPHLLVRLNTTNIPETMKQLKNVFQTALPHSAFEYTFLDDHIDALYRNESRTANIVLVFSFLSILVSCLGLFGLAAFAAERRAKEISVRRVLGATVTNISILLGKDFVRLVLASILIASPLAYYMMHNWLQDFQYSIKMQWWMFAGAGLLALLLAGTTVSAQSIRAALVNPVKNLKRE